MLKPRARALGIPFGTYKPGRWNALTDVPGVTVGHTTIVRGEGALKVGKGPVRTGVTAILPNGAKIYDERVIGGGFVLNGAGEVSGLMQVFEWGLIETPILLTNTYAVGQVADATVAYLSERHPEIGRTDDVVLPIVGECDDSFLNDIVGRHVKPEHVVAAIETAATGPVAEGSVGAGTGMMTFEYAGGIGTASRRVTIEGELLDTGTAAATNRFTVGVLVLSNFGRVIDLRIAGFPLGAVLAPKYAGTLKRPVNVGSIITVVATDAPLLSHQLSRLSKRAALGIGRMGSYGSHYSGEIVVAFSTANRVPRKTKRMTTRIEILLDERLDPLYEAVIEATEEAIVNALFAARDMKGVDDHFVPAAPVDDIVSELKTRGFVK
ncbi:MAG: P1 family peptidase [Deltaproteobacteria bacterium]|nr:P1 family peptidase [Deltaproteobacteria bacterium]